jgi:hypothetical protein
MADRLGDRNASKTGSETHLLSAREVLAAGEGDLVDGGGLLLLAT